VDRTQLCCCSAFLFAASPIPSPVADAASFGLAKLHSSIAPLVGLAKASRGSRTVSRRIGDVLLDRFGPAAVAASVAPWSSSPRQPSPAQADHLQTPPRPLISKWKSLERPSGFLRQCAAHGGIAHVLPLIRSPVAAGRTKELHHGRTYFRTNENTRSKLREFLSTRRGIPI